MSHRSVFRVLLCTSLVAGGGVNIPAFVYAQESQSILILSDSPTPLPAALSLPKIPSLDSSSTATTTVPATLAKEASQSERSIIEDRAMKAEPTEAGSETIRERFKDGRVHIERHVALDSEGNYVNHGNYEEWSNNGDVVCTGSFNMGQRQGPWIRFHSQKDAKLFTTQPYVRFKPPFQSSVEFENGQMNGVWAITDADRRVVSQIQLTRGTRNGQCTWFYPNGQVMFQADYTNGVLNGMFVEKSAEGKVVREEVYIEGQRSEVVKEQFANKTTKSETNYLTASQRVVTQDDWATVSLATYSTAGERVQHGPFIVYHENGQVKLRGSFERGVATGTFESWHPNGEKAVQGQYQSGKQQGKWSWWHPNGMRQSLATYDQGEVTEDVLAWNDQGKRVATNPANLPEVTTAERIVPASKQLLR